MIKYKGIFPEHFNMSPICLKKDLQFIKTKILITRTSKESLYEIFSNEKMPNSQSRKCSYDKIRFDNTFLDQVSF